MKGSCTMPSANGKGSGSAVYDDNGSKRRIGPGDSTWTPDGSGHGVDNSDGTEDLVFIALIVNK